MQITLRCIFITVAIFCVVELALLILMMNGYLTELEPMLYVFFNEDQMDAFKTLREALSELDKLDANAMNNDGQAAAALDSSSDDAIDAFLNRLLDGSGSSSSNKKSSSSSSTSPASSNSHSRTATINENTLAQDPAYLAINQKLTEQVLALNYDEVSRMLKFSSGVDVNFIDKNRGHLLFRLCSDKKETPQMLKMVDILLAQDDIDTNDDSTSWSPLKGALSAKNTQCVVKLLRHPNTVSLVHSAGMTCETVPHILPEISVIVDKNTKECFARHSNTVVQEEAKVREMMEKKFKVKLDIRLKHAATGKGMYAFVSSNEQSTSSSPSSSSSSPSSPTQQQPHQQQQQQSPTASSPSSRGVTSSSNSNIGFKSKTKRTQPWKLVLDPEQFDTAFEFLWFYVVGKDWEGCSFAIKLLLVVVGAHTLVVGGASVFYLSTIIENERAGIAPEAVVTPPVTPQQVPQQNQPPPPPAAAAANGDAAAGAEDGFNLNNNNNNNNNAHLPAAAVVETKTDQVEVACANNNVAATADAVVVEETKKE